MFLNVSDIHTINYETYGRSDGEPYLFIHGGPGLGYSENDKRFFDPSKHFVVFYDQRGCGKSKPLGEIVENECQHLLEDIDKLLDRLQIRRINIFAGSWGATIAVMYAAKNSKRVKRMILRGFFSASSETIDIYLRGGLREIHPKAWERLISYVPKESHNSIPEFYFEKIKSGDSSSVQFSYEWARYGLSISRMEIDNKTIDSLMNTHFGYIPKVKILLHYALSNFFMPENFVFEQAAFISDIPTVIVHGTHDYLCPLSDTFRLHKTINCSQLVVLEAGHSASDMEDELIKIIDS